MTDSSNPTISVIIPTRERCETLPYTIQTVLAQDVASLEVIVSDNASEDETPAVVRSFSDGRLKYIRAPRRMSMCDHWDFALTHAAGRYVLIIGDDDGILPGGLRRLFGLMESRPYGIYYWDRHCFIWPHSGRAGEVRYLSPNKRTRVLDIASLSRFSVRHGTWRYSRLPMAYNAAVARNLLDQIRERTGRVFHSTQPDVFTGFSLPALSHEALDVGEPITAGGQSSKSNSGAIVLGSWTEFRKYRQEFGLYRIHRTLFPDVPEIVNLTPDAALIAVDLFPEHYRGVAFGYNAMWAFMMRLYGLPSARELIAKRKQVAKYHSFTVPGFLCHYLLQRGLELRKRVGARRNPALRFEMEFRDGQRKRPRNIKEFCDLVGSS